MPGHSEIRGDLEFELGIPIPGRILPPERWTRTALKKVPEGPIDWAGLFGRTAPVILDIGCGNGRFLLHSAVARPACDHLGVDALPVVIRYATRRANQRGLANARRRAAPASARSRLRRAAIRAACGRRRASASCRGSR